MDTDSDRPLAPMVVPSGTSPPPGTPADTPAPPGGNKPTSAARTVIEWGLTIGLALLAALIIKTFVLQAFYIPSESMVPTLEVHDRVLVNKLSYHLHPIHRGDIVVFKRPPAEQQHINDLIKRVIALPNDTVTSQNGHILINGRPLNEPYLPQGTVSTMDQTVHVPAGYYWVMGDNRGNSADSRVFGPIPKSLIVGRAFIKVWPLSSIEFL